VTTTEQLEKAFGRIGLDEAAAKNAARPRVRPSAKTETKPAGASDGTVRLTEPGAILPKKKAAPASKAAKPASEAELAGAFKRIGMDEAGAKAAASGRGVRPAPAGSLAESGKARGFSASKASAFSKGRGVSEAAKDAAGLGPTAYAWTPDVEDASTWRLQISRSADVGAEWKPDEDLVRAAVAQLPGIAGYENAIDIPASDLPSVKATLRSAWIACGASIDEMPSELQQEALRRAFVRGGLSEKAAAIASRSRERSK
jgi:hypothetical protein